MHYYIGLDIGGTKCAVLPVTSDCGIKMPDTADGRAHRR